MKQASVSTMETSPLIVDTRFEAHWLFMGIGLSSPSPLLHSKQEVEFF